jgi:hypothetical protein
MKRDNLRLSLKNWMWPECVVLRVRSIGILL